MFLSQFVGPLFNFTLTLATLPALGVCCYPGKKSVQAVNPSMQILCHTVDFEILIVVRECVSWIHRGSQSLNMPLRPSLNLSASLGHFFCLYFSQSFAFAFSFSFFFFLLLFMPEDVSLRVSVCLWKFLFILINLCVACIGMYCMYVFKCVLMCSCVCLYACIFVLVCVEARNQY